jgi:hypothetical protein
MSEQNDGTKQTSESCGPGCCCGASGTGSRTKWVVCGVVALAAVVVLAARALRAPPSDTQVAQTYVATQPGLSTVPSVVPTSVSPAATGVVANAETTDDAKTWGTPLRALSELNKVATDTEGVFLVLPSTNGNRTAEIQKEVLTAASTITAGGTRMGTFLLSREAQEYDGFVKRIGAPAVLAICKGRGMAGIPDGQVTQNNLLRAFLSASAPSGCGPSGCGPSGCAPKPEGETPENK